MDTLRGMSADVTQRLSDGDFGQLSASGQALNPGIIVEAAQIWRVTARYEGMAGQFSVAASGQLSDREFDSEILKIWNDTSLSERRRLQLIGELLGTKKP